MRERRPILLGAAIGCIVTLARTVSADDLIIEARGNGVEAVAVQGAVVIRDGQQVIERRMIILRHDGAVIAANGFLPSREPMDKQLAELIDVLNLGCSLSDAQRSKLSLAGRGDIKQRLEQWEELNRGVPPAKDRLADGVRFEWDQERISKLMSTDVFGEDSLFRKTMRRALTSEQMATADRLESERAFVKHIEAWDERTRDITLTRESRHKIAWLLATKATPPPANKNADHVVLLQLAQLQHEARPLFDPRDWPTVEDELRRAREMEPFLRRIGAWPVTPGTAPPADALPTPAQVGF